MKKIIFAAAALFIFGFSNAQKVKYGFKAGVNIASQKLTLPTYPGINFSMGNVIGANVGGFVEIKVVPKWFFQPELLFSMQGAKMTASVNGQSAEETHSINYINVPFTVKYYLTNELNLQVGPQVGFLVSATDKTVSNITGLASSSKDSKSSYNSVDYGVNFGLGYDITSNISVSSRYSLSFTDVENTIPAGSTGSKNRVFSISLGYTF